MSGTPWTAAERAALLEVARAHGDDKRRAADAAGRPFHGTRNYIANALRAEWDAAVAEHRAAQPGPGERWAALRAEDAEKRARIAEAFDWLRPVELPPLARPRLTVKPSAFVVVSSDHHWATHDWRVESIILQAIHQLRPQHYILNGDGPDLLALSKYPKDARKGHSWELRAEQQGAKSWWRAVAQAGAGWGITLTETDANHSGMGRASRWTRWLNDNAAPLFGLDGFEADLSYPRYFHPADVPVAQVDEVILPGALRVRHGEVARKHGGYSARAHGDKWQASVLHGHTHRVGSSVKRRPGIPGVRPDEYLKTYEAGCACRIDDVHGYAAGADWCQGFAIVAVDEANDAHAVELVTVNDGVAVCATLGMTLRAD